MRRAISLGPLMYFSAGTICRRGSVWPHCAAQPYLIIFSAASSTSSLIHFPHRGMIHLSCCLLEFLVKAPTPLSRTFVKQGVSGTASVSQLNGTVDSLGHEVADVGFDMENLRVQPFPWGKFLRNRARRYTSVLVRTLNDLSRKSCSYYYLTARKGNSKTNRA